jgi:hypothetical protein
VKTNLLSLVPADQAKLLAQDIMIFGAGVLKITLTKGSRKIKIERVPHEDLLNDKESSDEESK